MVDDERDIIDSVEFLLRHKFRVLTATGGQQAVEVLRQNEVHLILSDQRMLGRMQGDALLSHARRIQPDAIRMLFTGYADIQAVINAVNEGQIFRYVLKPWDDKELIGIIRQGIERYELVEERKKLISELQESNRQLVEANAQLKGMTEQLLMANAALLNSLSKDKEQVGQYRLLEKVEKQGGMGTVYKALHVLLMKVVALKLLPADRMTSEGAIARFRREMKAVGRLDHPNIVQARDAGEADGTHYLVMEFIEGIESLEPLVVPRPCLDPGGVRDDPTSRNWVTARLRARFGPPGFEAVESDADAGRDRQDSRFRAGPSLRRELGHHPIDRAGTIHGDRRLYVTGTGVRTASRRCPRGSVQFGMYTISSARGSCPLQRPRICIANEKAAGSCPDSGGIRQGTQE